MGAWELASCYGPSWMQCVMVQTDLTTRHVDCCMCQADAVGAFKLGGSARLCGSRFGDLLLGCGSSDSRCHLLHSCWHVRG